MCNAFIYISNQETIFILEDTRFHYCGQKCSIHQQPWAGHRGKIVSGHSELALPHRGQLCTTVWRGHSNPSAYPESPCQASFVPRHEIRILGAPSGYSSLGKNSIEGSWFWRGPSFFPSFHTL